MYFDCLDAVAHGGNHGSRWGNGSRSWGKPRQSLMGETPKTALPPQDRAASPRPRCLPKTALHRYVEITKNLYQNTQLRDNSPHFQLFPSWEGLGVGSDSRSPPGRG